MIDTSHRLIRPVLLLAALLAVLLFLPAVPTAEAAATGPSKLTRGAPFSYGQSNRHTLGGTWYLKRDEANQGLRQRWQRTRDFSGWESVTMPNAFNAAETSERSYLGYVAWYGTVLRRPAASRSANWILQFNSVNTKARIFLNGRQIGSHNGGYIPFEVDAKGMKAGNNVLVVRVDGRLTDDTVPSIERRPDGFSGGWWNYGGITREVVLRRVNRWDVTTVATTNKLKTVKGKARGSARITVTADVRNLGRTGILRLRGKFGNQRVKFKSKRVRAGRSTRVTGTVVVRKPRLWSPLTPTLYTVRVNAPGVSWRSRVGIRKLAVSSRGILTINGQATRLRGISFHESDAATGSAWTPAQRDANNALITKVGARMIRSHYPLAPQQMEWADANGLLVWVQIPVYRPTNVQLRNKRYTKAAVKQTEEIVTFYRGYSSVLAWCLANEAVPTGTILLNRLFTAQKRAARKIDPQGLLSADYALSPSDLKQQPAYRKLDLLGINQYFSWYPGTLDLAGDVDDLPSHLARMHRWYAKQGLFITEFGAESAHHGAADEKGTYEYQTNFYSRQLNTLRNISYINGVFVWILRDYAVRPTWYGGNPSPTPPWSRKGIFELDGTPKPAAALIEREFKATPPLK